MAVQILGLRSYMCAKTGREKKSEKFFERNWRANSVAELFINLEQIVGQIPEDERWNLYYTASSCKETRGRVLDEQWVIPIDIDDITVGSVDDYVGLVCSELNIKMEETGVVFSGNGIQLIIGLKEPIADVGYFDRERHLYKAMCGKINQALYMHGMEGHADTSVFSPARLLRLPLTLNRKPNKPERMARVINNVITPIDFNLSDRTGVPNVIEGQHIHPRAYSKLPEPDPIGVQDGCDFIKYCKENQENISEPQWYAMLSLIGRLPNGASLCHEYSKGHPDYNYEDTEFKYGQALEASGPRTCENIDTLWDGCGNCPSRGKCKSPIMLRSDSYIGTKDTGFYDYTIDRNGVEKRGKPNYDDLVKYFYEVSPYTTMEVANIVHTHSGSHWVDVSRNRIHNFAEVNFDPSPSNQMCTEFESKLKRTKLKEPEWFTVEEHINFMNGVLRISDMEFIPHSIELGFRYVLPFAYDPTAKCPEFDKFLDEIMLGREDLKQLLLQFIGYSLAGVDPAIGQKALILNGGGSNGKSVLLDVIDKLAGEDNISALSMGNEINKLENRYQLSGKLINISEETPSNAMVDSSIFKALVTGGKVQARKLYCDSFSMRNYAKIIFACNELPKTTDLSYGMFRRLLIIPFDARFVGKTDDKQMRPKLYAELSGIFNRAMEGYRSFMLTKSFAEAAASNKALTEYIEDNDSVQNFITDSCALDNEIITATTKIYASYRFYCDQVGMKPMPMVEFSKRLKQILFATYNEDRSGRHKIDGRRLRGFKGLKLLEGGNF